MASSPLDPAAVSRLRRRAGADDRSAPAPAPVDQRTGGPGGWFEGDDWSGRVRSFTRRLLAPAERRVRREVQQAVARHDSDLRHQVDELRAELIRTRTDHAAELAALQEQLRSRS